MASRPQPAEPAAAAAIEPACRTLRLPTIRTRFAEIAAAAEREQLTYLGFLAELVMAECDDRTAAAPNAGSPPPGSPAPNGSKTSTSPPTPPSTPPPCTNSPPAAGSATANRSA